MALSSVYRDWVRCQNLVNNFYYQPGTWVARADASPRCTLTATLPERQAARETDRNCHALGDVECRVFLLAVWLWVRWGPPFPFSLFSLLALLLALLLMLMSSDFSLHLCQSVSLFT